MSNPDPVDPVAKESSSLNGAFADNVEGLALRAALAYAGLGFLWIGFSDMAVAALVTDRVTVEWLSMAKGWAFVAVTAALFYGALRTQLRRVRAEFLARRVATQALATREAQLSSALHMANAGYWEFDLGTRCFICNDHLFRVLRTTAEREGGHLIEAGRFAARFFPPEDAGLMEQELARVRAGAGADYEREFQHQVIRGDGSRGVLNTRVFARKDAAGRVTKVNGVTIDFSRQHAAEAALRASEAHFRAMFENSLDGLLLSEPLKGEVIAANAAACRMFRMTEADIRRAGRDGLLAADDPRGTALLEERRAHGRAAGEATLLRGDGSRFDAHLASNVFSTPEGPRSVLVVHDLTIRKQTAATLRRSEDVMRTLSRAIQQSPISVVITDPQGRIEYVNPRFTEVTGFTLDEVLGQNPRVLKSDETPAAVYRELWTTITSGREWRGELCNRRKDGGLIWEQVAISPVLGETGQIEHFVAVKEDVTQRRQLEEQLRRSQRLEAIGALSSGIAHDLNNILAPVLLAPSLLKETLKSDAERQLLSLIEQSARRGADIVRQLLTFSRGSGGERVPLQVRHLVKDMRAIVVETFPREITPVFDPASNVLQVLGDATQLHQVLLNLCVNARDAMPRGGTLTLTVRNVMVEADHARMHPPAAPGPYVLVTVKDTGHGIPPEIMERIFDPFFTTKGPGKGTGLGLSTVLGIVRSHGGFLEVESEVNRGATFRVFLPAAPSELPVPPSAMLAEPARGNGELVLVVDDEPTIRDAARIALERQGYAVLTASRGDEALAIYRLRGPEIALVLTDVMMPVMNGVELVRELRKLRPDVRVVVTTGMASDSKQAELSELGILNPLSKPCGQRELLEAVSEALRS